MDDRIETKHRYRGKSDCFKLVESERYVKMEHNFDYLACRAPEDNKGGANGDRIDRGYMNQRAVKSYHSYERRMSTNLRKGYMKIH